MTEKLEPCPFCGRSGQLVGDRLVSWVRCSPGGKCGAEGPIAPTREEAVRLWNRRPQKEPTP